MPPSPPRVFVSYSWDSNEHREQVGDFVLKMRSAGIDAWFDQFEEGAPPRSWPIWMFREIDRAQFVLAVCTPTYARRVLGEEVEGEGQGAQWEGAIITSALYRSRLNEDVKYIPVYLESSGADHVPFFLADTSGYDVGTPDGLTRLLRHLHNEPTIRPTPVGHSPFGVEVAEAPARSAGADASNYHGTDVLIDAVASWRAVSSDSAGAAPVTVSLAGADGWNLLRTELGADEHSPLARCFEVAAANGARSTVLEEAADDYDFASEYREHLSLLHRAPLSRPQRMHFFSEDLSAEDVWNLPNPNSYLGYVTLRWSGLGAVGRAMLVPPPEVAVAAASTERVQFFGQRLSVRGVPYMEDSGAGRGCAATALWMCHFSAALRDLVPRRGVAEFTFSAHPAAGLTRVVGQTERGMTLDQLEALSANVGLPAAVRFTANLPGVDPLSPLPTTQDSTQSHETAAAFVRTCQYYLRSGLPLIAISDDSDAELLAGIWDTSEQTFFATHSTRGPYVIRTMSASDGALWDVLLVPLPEDVFLPAEKAERFSALTLATMEYRDATELSVAREAGRVGYRTGLLSAERYLGRLSLRGFPEELLPLWRYSRLPRFLWVTEAFDRASCAAGEADVLAEVVVDPTSSVHQPAALLIAIPGVAMVTTKCGESLTTAFEPRVWSTGF
jgi:hypothetical protein